MHHARQHAETRIRERRHRLAHEAARLMAEGGIRDYHQAKLKAAARLGIVDDASLPRNREIEDALREYQRLFQGDAQAAGLRARREAALRALEFFAAFDARLVGAVLDGTADAQSPVACICTATTPDAVPRFLDEHAHSRRSAHPAAAAGSRTQRRFPGVAVQRRRADLRPDRAAAQCVAPGAAVERRREADARARRWPNCARCSPTDEASRGYAIARQCNSPHRRAFLAASASSALVGAT